MRVAEPQSRRAACGLIRLFFLGGVLVLCQSAGAAITNAVVANVTPSSFSVIWRAATNTTPSIAVFSDAGGVTNLAGQIGLESFPVRTGNPNLSGYQRRVSVTQLQQQTESFGLMMMRVSLCQPGATYYFRLTSTPPTGSPDVYPVSGPLLAVTTPAENTFVTNDQMLIYDLSDPSAEGRIVLLSNTNAAYPLAAIVGDGVGVSQFFFNVNDLFALAGTGNFTPVGSQVFTLNVLGSGSSAPAQTYTLTFTTDFTTAVANLFVANPEFLGVQVGSTVLRAGQAGSVSINGQANTNLNSIDLTLRIPAGCLTNLALQSLASFLNPAATTLTPQAGTNWLVHFAPLAGQSIVGSNQLASLTFNTVSNQPSAFVPLQVTTLTGTKADASTVSRAVAQSGRVVVIANQPLLEAGFASDGSRQLTLYGKAWTSYAIQYSTNFSGWSQVRHFPQTNLVSTIGGLGAPAPNAFYRALEFTPDPPVLDAVSSSPSRAMLAYGQPGRQYTLLAKTNLSNVVPWAPVQVYTFTNSFHNLTVTGGNNLIFYRLQRN